MSVKVIFECGGCDAKTEGTRPLRAEFRSISGRSYGLGAWITESANSVVPTGWVAFDPYTGCCYCPDCWRSIVEDIKS